MVWPPHISNDGPHLVVIIILRSLSKIKYLCIFYDQRLMAENKVKLMFEGLPLVYTDQYAAENLYALLYYNYVNASYGHFLDAMSLAVDEMSHEEVVAKCYDLINTITEVEGFKSPGEFFNNYEWEKSLLPVIQEVLEYKGNTTI